MIKRIIPIEKNKRVYRALKNGGYSPVIQKRFLNGRHIAVVGVRLHVAPWDPIIKVLLKEAHKIIDRALQEK